MTTTTLRQRFFLLLLLLSVAASAQKIDPRLTALLPPAGAQARVAPLCPDTAAVRRTINVSFHADGSVKSFSVIATLREGADCPRERLAALGVTLRRRIGRVLLLHVPAGSLEALGAMDEVQGISADAMCRPDNDLGRIASEVDEVADAARVAAHRLPQAYTGKGVLIGIIDTGIDYNHAAFRRADGTTRVRLALKAGYSEMQFYETPEQIAALRTDIITKSHGTHVAAIAAGSAVEGLVREGVAPEADLMLCGLGYNVFSTHILDAITMFFEFAKAAGQPCVVSVSIGRTAEFHDLVAPDITRGIEAYFTEEAAAGRICVFSAGNSGDCHASIRTVAPAAGDDGYTLRTVLGEEDQGLWNDIPVNRYLQLNNLFYNNDGSELDVVPFVVDVTTGARYTLAEKPLYVASSGEPAYLSVYKEVNTYNNKHYVKVSMNGFYQFHEANLKLAFGIRGNEGKLFHALDDRNVESGGFRSAGLDGFTEGSDDGAFNPYLCSPHVIGAGNYVTRTEWLPLGADAPTRYTDPRLHISGALSPSSSWGTDDLGVCHPDAVAPGTAIISAYNLHDINYFTTDGNVRESAATAITDRAVLFGRNNYYGVMSGTSMAAPHIAGIIALWLQAVPTLSAADVRTLLRETSRHDGYTDDPAKLPSGRVEQAGSGKVDALAGLVRLTASGVEEASGDDLRRATPATMYDVDAPCYNVLGQRVTKNAKGLIIYKGKKYLNR